MRNRRTGRKPVSDIGAKELQCSQSKITRLEQGQSPIRIGDLKLLLTLYEIGFEHAERLLQLHREARELSYWQHNIALIGTYSDFEAGATEIRTHDPLLVPGLLQTEQYATAVFRSANPDLTDERVRQYVAERRERLEVLDKKHPPRIWALLTEGCLRTNIGGPAVMADQLRHLRGMLAEYPNMVVQIVTFDAAAAAAPVGQFALLAFDGLPTIAYAEYAGGGAVFLEKRNEIDRVESLFEQLHSAALSASESLELIERLAGDYDARSPLGQVDPQ